MINTICVFCGSGTGSDPVYARESEKMAGYFLEKNITLVYGGANVGLMGIIADKMLENGGKVIGVMPSGLVEREVAHKNLTEFHVVKTMQERKAMMADLSDGFITLPGGYGTLDELFEVLSWNQLQIITKPVGMLNINGFWDPLIQMLEKARDHRFIRNEHHGILQIDEDIDRLVDKMNRYEYVVAKKWIDDLKEERNPQK